MRCNSKSGRNFGFSGRRVQYLNIGTCDKEETCEEESGRKDRKIVTTQASREEGRISSP
jgi:hypothetical protein